jgi:hypothetical protein
MDKRGLGKKFFQLAKGGKGAKVGMKPKNTLQGQDQSKAAKDARRKARNAAKAKGNY